MKIDVLQKDIDDGEPCSNDFCPIAIAASRECGNVEISVDNCCIYIGRDTYYLPPIAVSFITEFDKRASGVGISVCEPFSFEIKDPI